MKSLIGTWLLCTVNFTSYNPDIKKPVNITANVRCLVVDDSFSGVGSEDWNRHPIIVDCSKDIMWLKPTNSNGLFTFMKEDKDCIYD